MHRKLLTPFRYLWALPITALGLAFVVPTLAINWLASRRQPAQALSG